MDEREYERMNGATNQSARARSAQSKNSTESNNSNANSHNSSDAYRTAGSSSATTHLPQLQQRPNSGQPSQPPYQPGSHHSYRPRTQQLQYANILFFFSFFFFFLGRSLSFGLFFSLFLFLFYHRQRNRGEHVKSFQSLVERSKNIKSHTQAHFQEKLDGRLFNPADFPINTVLATPSVRARRNSIVLEIPKK